jgi:hypothetical protein
MTKNRPLMKRPPTFCTYEQEFHLIDPGNYRSTQCTRIGLEKN